MVKSKKYSLYLFFVFLLLIAVYALISRTTSTVQPEVKQASIYVDPASFPSMLQMVEVVKSNPEEPKFIFWERQPKLSRFLRKQYHITTGKTTYQSYSELTATERVDYFNQLQKQIKKFISNYPNASLKIHLNLLHNDFVLGVLQLFDREQRKITVHWYEDCFSCFIHTPDTRFVIPREENPQRLLDFPVPTLNKVSFSLSLLPVYSSVLHIAHPEKLIKNKYSFRALFPENVKIEPIDYKQIQENLTDSQRKMLLKFARLNPTDLQPFFQNKPVLLGTLGHSLKSSEEFNKMQFQIIEEVINDKFGQWGELGKDYFLLLKEHPWHTNDQSLKKSILKKYPFVHFLPKDFPLEILFLTGYIPEKTFGYSSSVFFALPSTRVLFYIPRPEDPYVPWLLKFGNLRAEQIYAGENES